MTWRGLYLLGLVVTGVCACTQAEPAESQQATRNPFVGAWLIRQTSVTGPSGTSTNENPEPCLYIFTERHFSNMLIPGPERQPFSAERTHEERLVAYDNFIADGGTYEYTDSTLTARNIIAKIPNKMIGSPSHRVQSGPAGSIEWLRHYVRSIMMRSFLRRLVLAISVFATVHAQETSFKPSPELYPVVRGGKWGFVDAMGRLVIEPRFDTASVFSEGLAPVSLGRELWFIRPDGSVAFKVDVQRFDFFNVFISEGRLLVCGSGKCGFLDTTGRLVIEPAFEGAAWFTSGLCPVRVQGKWGYIDQSGRMVISPRFDWVGLFGDGLAPVQLGDRYGYIDTTGSLQLTAIYLHTSQFENGVATVATDKNNWALIDRTGKPILRIAAELLGRLSYDLAPFRRGGRWGYVSASGKITVAPRFEDAGPFVGGLAQVKLNGRWGFINTGGEFAVEPKFDSVTSFFGSLSMVRIGDRLGLIDKKGTYVWPLQN